MASFPVNVTLRLNGAQFNNLLQQIGTNAKNAKVQLGGLQSQVAGIDRGMMRGAGSFFIMHRAMQAGIGIMKRGVQGAIDFDYALSRLQWAIKGNASQMRVFEKIAQETAIQLGPIGATEVIQGMERLARSTNMTMRGMAGLAPEVAQVVSNIVELSDKTVTVPQMFTNIQQLITAFGGAANPKNVMNTLTAFHGVIQAFAAEDPERLFKGMLAAIPTMKGMDLSPEEIMITAAMRKLLPSRGRNTSGIDLAQLSRIVFGGYEGQTGKKIATRREALTDLGLLVNGRPAAQDIGLMPALFKMSQTVERKRATLPPDEFRSWMNVTFERAFNTQLVRDTALTFAQNEATLVDIMSRLEKVVDPKTMSRNILGTSRGTIGQLVESVDTLLTNLYRKPLRGVTPWLQSAGNVVQGMTAGMNRDAFSGPAALAALLGLPMGMAGMATGAMTTAAGFAGAGGALATGGAGLVIAGLVGAVIVGGTTAYRQSDEFAFAVDHTKDVLVNYFDQAMAWVEEVRQSPRWQAFIGLLNDFRNSFGGEGLGALSGFAGSPDAAGLGRMGVVFPPSTFDTRGRYMRMRERHRKKRAAWQTEVDARAMARLTNTGAANPNVGPRTMSPGVKAAVTSRHLTDANTQEFAKSLYQKRQGGTSSEVMSKAIR